MNQYDIRITGKDLKRFIGNLQKLKIQFYHIQYFERSIIIRVNERDYQKIKEIKTIYEIEVVHLYGPICIIQFLKTYKIFFLFLGLGLAIITFLTHITFDIAVIHNKAEIRDLIIEELKNNGIDHYHFTVPFQKQEKIVENIIQKHRETIEWMEIERIGVSYIIKVEERKIKQLDTETEPRDLVAKKDGMITSIEATTGDVKVVPKQYVKKGDVLISGQIKNKETLMAKVRAKGKIFAETWYDVTVELPYHYQEVRKTGNKKKALTIQFLGKEINLFDFSPYQEKEATEIYRVFNALLPISISWNQEQELIKKEVIYTKDMALIEASSIARKKLMTKLGSEDQILYEKSLKITEEDSKIVIVIFFKVKEDITDYQPIKEEVQEQES